MILTMSHHVRANTNKARRKSSPLHYKCGGMGIGPYCMYSLPYMYVCVVHVGHAKVIVSARSPLYMMGGYVTKAWDEGYYIRC